MIKYETNSKLVKPGQIFVAICGHTVDGHDYIEEAIKNGAESLVVMHDVSSSIPYKIVDDTEQFLIEEIPKLYEEELKKLKIIGITGTNGKTTSAYLTYQMLLKLGKKASYLGTIGYFTKDKEITLNNTTPDIITLYKLLLDAINDNIEYFVMEVSSHSISLKRIEGLKFEVCAFTNLTQDHLDFYKTIDNYLKAKLKILDYLDDDKYILLNSDDENSKYFMNHLCKTYGINGDYKIINYISHPDKTEITFSYDNKTYNVITNLTSKFNVYNYLTMLSILNSIGFSIDNILENTKDIYPPKGRCETYKVKNGYAVIDYAHTPDAVLKVISAYNELKKNRVITIVGCGGDRDPKKRPIMGNIATDNSDFVIFTSDNPRTEDPLAILNDITKENHANNFIVIPDRKEAILRGIELMEKNDILLILGKGHENYQIIGHEKIHFDDAEIIKSVENN